MEDTNERNDPQDTAEFSKDMGEPAVEQKEITACSVFDALVAFGKTHGKVFRTNGKHADMMRFDLTTHSVTLGNTFVICRGEIRMPVLETAAVKVSLEKLPWLAKDERDIDPVMLFEAHYLSRPNGSEKFMACNFPAKDVDELTDDEIVKGLPRAEARVRLEAWMLCAALDGTLERYVTRQPNWKPGNTWWSPEAGGPREGRALVIKTSWWYCPEIRAFELRPGYKCAHRQPELWNQGYKIAELGAGLTDKECRTLQMAVELRRTVEALCDATFRLQMSVKRFDCDPLLADANSILRYIDAGKTPNAQQK